MDSEEKRVTTGERKASAGTQKPKKATSTARRDSQSVSKEVRAYSALRARGVSDQAIMRWEKVIVKSGLSPGAVQSELVRSESLSKLQARTQERIDRAQQALAKVQEKNEELRKKYASAWDSVMRYQLLREEGVDGAVLQRWEKLIAGNGLDPGKVEDELISFRNLDQSRKELEGRVSDLDTKEAATKEHVKALERELAKLELHRTELLKSMEAFTESVHGIASNASDTMVRARDEAGESLRIVSQEAQAQLTATAAALDGFKAKIEETYASAVKTGETIGKYEALGPLVKFVESGEGKPGEVIPLMSLLARTLAKWAKEGDPVLLAKARDLEVYLDEKLRMV